MQNFLKMQGQVIVPFLTLLVPVQLSLSTIGLAAGNGPNDPSKGNGTQTANSTGKAIKPSTTLEAEPQPVLLNTGMRPLFNQGPMIFMLSPAWNSDSLKVKFSLDQRVVNQRVRSADQFKKHFAKCHGAGRLPRLASRKIVFEQNYRPRSVSIRTPRTMQAVKAAQTIKLDIELEWLHHFADSDSLANFPKLFSLLLNRANPKNLILSLEDAPQLFKEILKPAKKYRLCGLEFMGHSLDPEWQIGKYHAFNRKEYLYDDALIKGGIKLPIFWSLLQARGHALQTLKAPLFPICWFQRAGIQNGLGPATVLRKALTGNSGVFPRNLVLGFTPSLKSGLVSVLELFPPGWVESLTLVGSTTMWVNDDHPMSHAYGLSQLFAEKRPDPKHPGMRIDTLKPLDTSKDLTSAFSRLKEFTVGSFYVPHEIILGISECIHLLSWLPKDLRRLDVSVIALGKDDALAVFKTGPCSTIKRGSYGYEARPPSSTQKKAMQSQLMENIKRLSSLEYMGLNPDQLASGKNLNHFKNLRTVLICLKDHPDKETIEGVIGGLGNESVSRIEHFSLVRSDNYPGDLIIRKADLTTSARNKMEDPELPHVESLAGDFMPIRGFSKLKSFRLLGLVYPNPKSVARAFDDILVGSRQRELMNQNGDERELFQVFFDDGTPSLLVPGTKKFARRK